MRKTPTRRQTNLKHIRCLSMKMANLGQRTSSAFELITDGWNLGGGGRLSVSAVQWGDGYLMRPL